MEEQDCEDALRLVPLTFSGLTNDVSIIVSNGDAYQHSIVKAGSSGIHNIPVPIPQWINCRTPRNYVEFLAEKGFPEIQKGVSYDISAEASNFGNIYPSQVEEYSRLQGEWAQVMDFTGAEHQLGVQKQAWNEEYSNVSQANSGLGAAAANYSSENRRKISRQRAYASDRCRRLRISERIDALQELLPHSREGGKASVLDDIVDHIKYLQFQVKDLSRSRLGSESTSSPFIFLEGYGHYFIHEQMIHEPLEEMMGKLFEVNPSAATELLHSRGLYVMPMAFAEGFHKPA
ncbi:transcription factor bHLH69-like isoform X1 [Olea europaea var. sylvestris]|uniref:transcription factor bHLH69-like isoform X1 n=1 Tax=Olea europaea var. sylvestris TaxID=158386 RepID=UPI000C1D6FE3|nr:transcription factor bHLH69-like isoform X1 [Olea europaea var. sylvestris]